MVRTSCPYHRQAILQDPDDSGTDLGHPADREYENQNRAVQRAAGWAIPPSTWFSSDYQAAPNDWDNLRMRTPENSDNEIDPALEWFDICDGPDGRCVIAECGIVPDCFAECVERRLRTMYNLPVEEYPLPENCKASGTNCDEEPSGLIF